MASTITRDIIRTAVRDRGDFQSTSFFPDSQLNTFINESIAACYDVLAKYEPSRFQTSSTISVVSGTASYSLPATFYRLFGVELADSSYPTGYVSLERRNFHERNDWDWLGGDKVDTQYDLRGSSLVLYPTPTWSGTIRLIFIPTAPSLSDDLETWDCVNVWYEWVVCDVLAKCAIKEESDPSPFLRAKSETEARIASGSIVDIGEPPTVTVHRTRLSPYHRRGSRYWR